MKIAVVGKGGVGKTTISVLLVKILSERGKVLAIDADPAGGLSAALGVKIKKTLEDVRNEIATMIKERYDKVEIASSIDYKVLEALYEHERSSFLAIGRPESEGCYCQLNLMLREAIELLSGPFDYVVIDGEAGIEQINRRVMRSADVLLVVTDTTKKGLHVANQIKSIARTVAFRRCILVVNKVKDSLKVTGEGFDYVFLIPEDDTILKFDAEGRPLLDINDSPALRSVESMAETLLLEEQKLDNCVRALKVIKQS